MKIKLLIVGCFVAGLCLPGCNDDKEVTVSEIEISPNPVPVLEIGRTVELTATVAPANATEDLRWVVYDEAVVSVEGDGPKALLTAKKAGTTRIFATNRTGIVVSEELTVKVNSAEYAGYVTGNYLGDARISGALNVDISGVGVSLTRVGREPATVKLVVVANVPNMGELTITGEEVMVAPGTEPETYVFEGSAPLEALDATIKISGTYRATEKSLSLTLAAEGLLTISITAVPGAPADYAANVAGDYAGLAKITGQLNMDLDARISLKRISNSKAELLIEAEVPGTGPMTISGADITVGDGPEENTYALSGKAKASLMDLDLNVTGVYRVEDRTLTLALAEVNGMVDVNITAVSFGADPSDFGTVLAGEYLGDAKLAMAGTEMDISGAQAVMERVDNETVKLTVAADVPGMNTVTVAGDAITLSKGAGNTYTLGGMAAAPGIGDFTVTGSYNAMDRTLTLNLVSSFATIDLTADKVKDAEPPQPNVAEIVVGNYLGTADVTGAVEAEIPDVPVTLEAIDDRTDAVRFTIVAPVPGMGLMTITCDALAIDATDGYVLSGEAVLAGMDLDVTINGTYDDATGTLKLTLVAAGGVVTIAYEGTKEE